MKSSEMTESVLVCRCFTSYDGKALGPDNLLPLKTSRAVLMDAASKGRREGSGLGMICCGGSVGTSKMEQQCLSYASMEHPG